MIEPWATLPTIRRRVRPPRLRSSTAHLRRVRRKTASADDYEDVSAHPGAQLLLDVYDDALPAVYGYLLRRCRDSTIAEDLTSETFLAAMDSVRRVDPPDPTVPWLIGVARHKLADHWRRMQRTAEPVGDAPETAFDTWDTELDRLIAERTLARISPLHRAILTLRYVDDCTVPRCAEILGRTVMATEALLTRAKREFRAKYPDDDRDRNSTPRSGEETQR
ncbi:RNA polymerase sigma-70 factor, ECF subfamily [Williamsia maris]|uniref:RNA polymerase sigma-70 factor, ECF subfamily n=1 Tax=Williamsia maris TaxID=72806 RepID=A0ABT1HAG3_9NOCA|nr:RNA polymerase sigma-70 factor, ECF subfamily [Williamsia maris]